MRYRTLGRTGLKISEVSLGSWLAFVNATENIENLRHCFCDAERAQRP
jgi:aryl-alcohol dehydrogenase-like predicted oxidoreductase